MFWAFGFSSSNNYNKNTKENIQNIQKIDNKAIIIIITTTIDRLPKN
jgi:hypothetical protein